MRHHDLKPELVTAPTLEVISVGELKDDLAILDDFEDQKLRRLRERAVAYLDGYSGILGRAIGAQAWKQSFHRFRECQRLALGPITSLDAITYFDEDGNEQVFDHSGFEPLNDHLGPKIWWVDSSTLSFPNTMDRPDAVTITWTAGMAATAADVHPNIAAAVSMLVGHWRLNPEAATLDRQHPIAMGVHDILAPIRFGSL